MYSDDSGASEIASEAEDAYEEDSAIASEVEESTDEGRLSKPPVSATTSAVKTPSVASDAYDDDDYEEDDEGYSVDFEAEEEITKQNSTKVPSPLKKPVSAAKPFIIEEDVEYGEASFEEESRRSQSAGQSKHHIVNLSVPVSKSSPTFQLETVSNGNDSSTALYKPAVLQQNINSLTMNPTIPTKPVAILSPTTTLPDPTVTAPAPMFVIPEGEEKKFTLLLRKVESKFEDEIEELREKNTLLTWKERELKSELRMHRDELKMRKSRLEKKRKRANDRRREHERMVDRLKMELVEMTNKMVEMNQRHQNSIHDHDQLTASLLTLQTEKRAVEERNFALTDKLQATLSCFHELSLKFEEAVNSKLEVEKRMEEVVSAHRVEMEILEHKCRVEIEAIQKTLEMERESRAEERLTLPTNYRMILDAEKERYEKLEATLLKQMREMEVHLARETAKQESELTKVWELKKQSEERAEKRVQEELSKITREREAVDDQRRELLVSVTRTNARFDEERGKLDAIRAQLEVRQMKLMEERTELETKSIYLEERCTRLMEEENTLEVRKSELTKLGRETLEKTHLLTQKMADYQELKAELVSVKKAMEDLKLKFESSEKHTREMQLEKESLEKTALQLQHERLLVAKQRIQSRYFLDGARKLESMLQKQQALEKK